MLALKQPAVESAPLGPVVSSNRSRLSPRSANKIMALHFGNVMGSSVSALPIFKQQIEDGGPVTVTNPEVTRYFMTIPEAVALILQSGGMGQGGEILSSIWGSPSK